MGEPTCHIFCSDGCQSSSYRLNQRLAHEKVFATSSLGLPASKAESTLNLRSFEYGFISRG